MTGPARVPVARDRRPIFRYLQVQKVADSVILELLVEAAEDVAAIIASMEGSSSFSAQLRVQQYRMVQASLRERIIGVMEGVGSTVREYRPRAAGAALDVADVYDRFLMEALNDPEAARLLRESARRTAERGFDTALARATTSRVDLSQRVYNASVAVNGQVDRLVYSALATGKSAREIALAVSGLINPATPGGVSYAAMRLGRTELNNAFHAQQIAAAQRPWVDGVKWNLSGSHPEPDECDYFAGDEHMAGRGPGVFPTGSVPAKPHPQCLCFTTPETVSDDAFVAAFLNGSYDDFLRAA